MNVFQPLKSLVRTRRIHLPREEVRRVIHRHGAQEWFVYIFEKRHKRWDVWKPGYWIDDHLARDSRILETGCGCGMNLIWLAQRGFRSLHGFDNDPTAVAAGKELSQSAGVHVTYWEDDGLAPTRIPDEPFDAVVALNWTSLVEGFGLDGFLRQYSRRLAPNGVLILDAIDARYNATPNNEYQSADWNKPVEQRRPSEYKNRYSTSEIEDAAAAVGLGVEKRMTAEEVIPKNVFILRRTRRPNQ